MMQEKKGITFIVIPQRAAKTYTFRLSHGLLWILAVVVVFCTASFIYMLAVHKSLVTKALRFKQLSVENSILRDQAHKLADLEGELALIQNARQHLYELAGMSPEQAGEVAVIKGAQVTPAESDLPLTAELPTKGLSQTSSLDTAQTGAAHVPSLWPVRGWVTAEFDESMPGREKRHQGIDIAAAHGTPIMAGAGGSVAYAGWDKNLGMVVIVDHQNGLSTLYGHCSKITVEVGDEIFQGQVIAHLGNTGRSSAPHLHFEVRENGVPVDPRSYLGP
jgi:murein DD-endopeptidase MepM/ murein hydrolase activator NlpD